MTKLWVVVERDLRMFFRYKFILVMRAIWFVSQIALFGLIFPRMLITELQDVYFPYYVIGVSTIMLFSTTMFIGYDIQEEANHGVVEYLLSLPISRKELVLGRSIGGALRSFVYVGPLLLIVLFIVQQIHPVNLLIAFAALFLFAFGISGMSITLAVSIKSHDKFDIFLGVLDALIVRLSTILYPKAFMPEAYAFLAQLNPLSFASDLFRWGAGPEAVFPYLSSQMVALVGLFFFFLLFTFVSINIYEKRLEGGGWE